MRVTLLIKHEGELGWRVPEVAAYANEEALKVMLRDAPELLPFEDLRRPVVMVDEFPVVFGFADLVGVSASGAITVIECKLRTNPDMRRTIVGQLFAYAAALWDMPYEDFEERWQSRARTLPSEDPGMESHGRPSLVDSIAPAAIAKGLAFDATAFITSVRENLRAGTFTLVLAVDEITPELQRVIEYLSAHTAANVDVVALELGYVADGDVEVLVPQQFGLEIAQSKAASLGRGARWDADAFIARLHADKGDWAVPLLQDVLGWAQAQELDVWYGSGAKIGTVYAGLIDDTGARRALIGILTSGVVEVEFNQIKYLRSFTSHEARVQLLNNLNLIDGHARPEKQADSWPTIDLSNLRTPDAYARFKSLLDDVVSRTRLA